jgi:hypothetical protein
MRASFSTRATRTKPHFGSTLDLDAFRFTPGLPVLLLVSGRGSGREAFQAAD